MWPCIKRETRWKGTRNNLTPFLGSWSPELSSDNGWTMSIKVLYMLSSHSRCLPEATRANIPPSLGRQKTFWNQTWALSIQGWPVGPVDPERMVLYFCLLDTPACSFKKGSLFALLQSLTQDISHFLLYNSSFHFAIWNISLLQVPKLLQFEAVES